MDRDARDDEVRVQRLYRAVLDAWNRRDAEKFGALFAASGSMVGFDGSQVDGSDKISAHLAAIFAEHPTPSYTGLVDEVRMVAPGVAILSAVAGLIPPPQDDIVPALNAIQTLVAVARDGVWQAELFQNTPAQFHGRPELADALTARLRATLRKPGAHG